VRLISRSGNIYNLLGEIKPTIEDIAWSLSGINRYVGSSKEMYNVADHCLRVSELVPSHLAFAALMHDAAEAITNDVPSPVKEALRHYGNAWDRLEADVERKIRVHFHLPLRLHSKIIKADEAIRASEMRDLFTPEALKTAREMGVKIAKSGETPRIFPITQKEAFERFVDRASRVGNGMR
jgi:5'-deoxynucleotidase YfbR-like HD superfamily hydrolase